MYAFIRGVLVEATPAFCLLDVQGVGYKLFTPTSLLGQLPGKGSQLLLHCSFVVREQSQALYGFLTEKERDFFEQLIGISGVGPKMALSIIGHLSLNELQLAISAENSAVLCKIPGIGKKTAERLIVEMRDKFKALSIPEPGGLAIRVPGLQQSIADAMGALVNLGYSHAIAQKAVQKGMDALPDDADLATLITAALKNI